MNGNTSIKILVIIALAITTACKSDNKRQQTRLSYHETKDMLIRINKTLNSEDKEKIEEYIAKQKIEGMEASQTGLYHLVTGEPNGKAVETGNVVQFSYTISLLDGTRCYSSKNDGLKSFKVGQGGVESGIEEGILLMKQGQNAIFILPPHLAHGLVGDGKRIPSRAIIVYNVELLSVTN